MLGGSSTAAQLREVALVAFSNGVTINNSLGQLLQRKLLHHSIKLALPPPTKTSTRALRAASNVGKRTTGQRTARINQILILTKVGEQH